MNIELERKKLEIKRVQIAIDEFEFKIMEREADIARIRENIDNQVRRITELKQELKQQGE